MGFKIETIVHPDDQRLAQQFVCGVCLCIMNEPVQTVCDHMFCQDCVAPCLACPTCRTAFTEGDRKPLRECNRILFRMMHDLKVWCPYHSESKAASQAAVESSGSGEERPAKKPRVEQQHCDWKGSYTDLLASHLDKCPYHVVPCPKGCGVEMRRCDIEGHAPDCSKNFEQCPICKESVKNGAMPQHRESKAQLHVQLLEARLAEKEGDTVEQAVREIRKRLDDLETTRRQELCDAGSRGFKWEIASGHMQLPMGQALISSDFHLFGFGPFAIYFYPKGRIGNAIRTCSYYLQALGRADLSITHEFEIDGTAIGSSKHNLSRVALLLGENKTTLLQKLAKTSLLCYEHPK
mmetsp:Transcript_152664/g.489623  ORF Transcript_152664/g.489623 Transcript_152664/m.489623 type:complete len:350 (+) Transcript_152664:133-1182(+)